MLIQWKKEINIYYILIQNSDLEVITNTDIILKSNIYFFLSQDFKEYGNFKNYEIMQIQFYNSTQDSCKNTNNNVVNQFFEIYITLP